MSDLTSTANVERVLKRWDEQPLSEFRADHTERHWARAKERSMNDYDNVENNIRVADHETVWCSVCQEEAVVISNDGKRGLCADHYEMLAEAQSGDD